MSESLKQDLVLANRILAEEGIIRIFGHLSVREPGSDQILISTSKSPALVTEDDILRMTLDGELLDNPDTTNVYAENIIHRAIYRERTDVNGIVHHHAHEILPYTITDIELKPAFLGGTFFHEGISTFSEYDEEYGRLIVGEAEAQRMAQHLGDRPAQLLEGHGANVVDSSIRKAVSLTIFLIWNARYQFIAEQLGTPTYLGPPSPELLEYWNNLGGSDRMWDYLVSKVETDF